MKPILIAVSGILVVTSSLPYLADVVRGKTKPRVVSWLIWAVLSGIASAASFVAHEVPSGILMAAVTLETSLISILGFKHGDRTFERLDVYCFCGAVAGLGLWFVFNSPSVAIVASVAIDLVGAIPTLKHSWQKPHEETWVACAISGAGSSIIVMIADKWTITALAYPVYNVAMNIALVACVLASPHHKLAGEPAELREL